MALAAPAEVGRGDALARAPVGFLEMLADAPAAVLVPADRVDEERATADVCDGRREEQHDGSGPVATREDVGQRGHRQVRKDRPPWGRKGGRSRSGPVLRRSTRYEEERGYGECRHDDCCTPTHQSFCAPGPRNPLLR